jgi:hypothetical protein
LSIPVAAAASYWLSGPHPKAYEVRRHLAAMQRMTHSLGSRRRSQCVWSSLEGASRSHSSFVPLDLGDWSPAVAPRCTRGVHPCGSPGPLDNHRGIAIFES